MPTYDYRCTQCGHVFELFHRITDDTPKLCPNCGSTAVRVPSGGAGLLFHGSGFYITDYRSKGYQDKAKQEKGGGSSGGSGGTTGGDGGSKKSGGDGGGPKKSGGGE